MTSDDTAPRTDPQAPGPHAHTDNDTEAETEAVIEAAAVDSPPLDSMTAIRDVLVDTALMHVAFDGWTMKSLRAAARDADFDAEQADRAFPKGPVQAVAHWCDLADRRMEAALDEADTEGLRLPERVALAIRLRLQHWDMDREAVRRGVALLSLPGHAPTSIRCTYRTVDTIWWAAGDTATDFNFYTKRLQLAGIYSATLLYWLDDSSEECVETWGFLDRRLAGVARLLKTRRAVEARLARVPNPLNGLRSLAEGLGRAPRPRFRAR
ncbi:COQ9 family protein [Roseospira visakhapatnamensis]|uniref:Ubiquinone biosynthesis protein COQ9 n=1 Tax=Roseospira visakhapatnamensis TaxID=390880 RepID=A0A7W6RE94_9PROT|nr:COQ9 family protein [Roseospira visakhapatnamensis]MBB4266873.1 ubiquinone biosynthesis protein COQ9 [Roseospira visakhapatnamensis]